MKKTIPIILIIAGLVFIGIAMYAEKIDFASEVYYCISLTCIVEAIAIFFSKNHVCMNVYLVFMCLLALMIYKFTGMILYVCIILAATLFLLIISRIYRISCKNESVKRKM